MSSKAAPPAAPKCRTEAGSSADVDVPVLGSDDHPIIEAVIKEDTKLLTILLRAGCSPNVTDSKGQTALFIASKSGHTDVVAKLLAHDADVTAKDHESSRTALEEVERVLEGGKLFRMNNPQYDAGNAKVFRSLQVVATTLEMATKKAEEALEVHKEKQILNLYKQRLSSFREGGSKYSLKYQNNEMSTRMPRRSSRTIFADELGSELEEVRSCTECAATRLLLQSFFF
jgi:hypothetical protein